MAQGNGMSKVFPCKLGDAIPLGSLYPEYDCSRKYNGDGVEVVRRM